MVEAALTTALADRPYSQQLAFNAMVSPTSLSSGGIGAGSGTASGNKRRDYYPYGSGGGAVEPSGVDGGSEGNEEDGLAEVDFRHQYDDFA